MLIRTNVQKLFESMCVGTVPRAFDILYPMNKTLHMRPLRLQDHAGKPLRLQDRARVRMQGVVKEGVNISSRVILNIL